MDGSTLGRRGAMSMATTDLNFVRLRCVRGPFPHEVRLGGCVWGGALGAGGEDDGLQGAAVRSQAMGRGEVEVPRAGETVVWEGRSRPGAQISLLDMVFGGAAMVGVLVGFSVLYDGNVALGLPMFAFGSYWYLVQYVIDPIRRRHVRYVLTLDHAYLVHRWPRHHTTVVDLRRCGPSALRHHRDSTSTITFGLSPRVERILAALAIHRPAFRRIEHGDALMPVIRGESDHVLLVEIERPPSRGAGG